MNTHPPICQLFVPRACLGPELTYTVDYIFGQRLGLECSVVLSTHTLSVFEIRVGTQAIAIPNSGFFEQIGQDLRAFDPPAVSGQGADCVLFPHALPHAPLWDFDLLAAVFFLLARLDELAPAQPADPHGRFVARSSSTYAHGGHRYPLIDIWVWRLRHQLHNLEVRGLTQETFAWWNTIDIDQVHASHGKPLWIKAYGIMRALLRAHVYTAIKLLYALLGGPDPFCTLHMMKMPAKRNILFLLCGGSTSFDLARARSGNTLSKFVQAHLLDFEWGIHPSYASSQQTELITQEKGVLEALANQTIHFSRQHYLRFRWPHTQQNLSDLGITHDFSMGFADDVGFRAGTSRPFPFFNPILRKPTPLTIVPFSTMDVSLKQYLAYTPSQASELIHHMIQTLKECHGLYVSLWHHEALGEIDGWKGWKDLYLDLAKTLID